ncbi:hypothetical protein BGW38_002664 [Lunasporangiospora selenospora]|uniref:Uncharacterized protein n=1 Tax=Lunasporangiospora selenospora TaxID=979761 RepID=A0A9P6FSA1_9FUNG|nr:hypothetical protein BGW38_002664 [Lunasporangiospora selenospora]
MLKWVQLQVLDSSSSVLIENLDHSTRADWDAETRTRSVKWSVPTDWTPGDYIIRAFGNASYPCYERTSTGGRQSRCELSLEDQETLRLTVLKEAHACPSASQETKADPVSSKTLLTDSPTSPSDDSSVPDEKDAGHGSSTKNGDSSHDLDVLSDAELAELEDLADIDETLVTGGTDLLEDDPDGFDINLDRAVDTTEMTGDGAVNGTEGYLSTLQIVLDQSAVQRIQEQTIYRVINKTADYNLQNQTLTMRDGTVVAMSDLMDNATSTMFLQALEMSNATFSNGEKAHSSAELLETLHQNSSMIALPAPLNATRSGSGSFVLSDNNSSSVPGRNFVQDHSGRDQSKHSMSGSSTKTVLSYSAKFVMVFAFLSMTI